MKKITIVYAALIVAVLAITSCQLLKDVATNLNNVQRLKYKIDNVSNFTMSGMNISNKKTASDFSAADLLKLTAAVTTGKLPASFTINVTAKNPNDGTNNTVQNTATITSLPWELYIDNTLALTGNIGHEVSVPSTGLSVNIPLQVNIDLVQLYKGQGVAKIIEVALALGGANHSETNIKLVTQPSVKTAIGVLTYPEKITVVNYKWTE